MSARRQPPPGVHENAWRWCDVCDSACSSKPINFENGRWLCAYHRTTSPITDSMPVRYEPQQLELFGEAA